MSEKTSPAKNLNGIRGWLVLVAITIIASAAAAPFGIWVVFEFYRQHTEAAAATLPFLHAITWIEATEYALWLAFVIWVAVLFFKKKKNFPKMFIIFLVLGLLTNFFDLSLEVLWSQQEGLVYFESWYLTDNVSAVAGPVIGNLITLPLWIAYIRTSKRVKATFTR